MIRTLKFRMAKIKSMQMLANGTYDLTIDSGDDTIVTIDTPELTEVKQKAEKYDELMKLLGGN